MTNYKRYTKSMLRKRVAKLEEERDWLVTDRARLVADAQRYKDAMRNETS